MAAAQHPHEIPSDIEWRIAVWSQRNGKRFGLNQADIEDAAQESRAKVVEKHDEERQPWEQIRPQVKHIVRNTCADIGRRRNRRREVYGEAAEGVTQTAAFRDAGGARHEFLHAHRMEFIKALLKGAKHVQSYPRRESDQVARPLTRTLLRSWFSRKPRCVADIGRELGIHDRRLSNATWNDVRGWAKGDLEGRGFDGAP